jgi:hypothetical protein
MVTQQQLIEDIHTSVLHPAPTPSPPAYDPSDEKVDEKGDDVNVDGKEVLDIDGKYHGVRDETGEIVEYDNTGREKVLGKSPVIYSLAKCAHRSYVHRDTETAEDFALALCSLGKLRIAYSVIRHTRLSGTNVLQMTIPICQSTRSACGLLVLASPPLAPC